MWGAILLTLVLQLVIIYVPFLQPVFKTCYLNFKAIVTILIVTIISVFFIELLKMFTKKK